MTKRAIQMMILALLVATPLVAQTTIETLTLSKDFASVPGTPRVVRNGFNHVWAVAWRQQGSPSKIYGRIVTSEGNARPRKTLAKAVTSSSNNFDIFYDSVNYNFLLAFENSKGLNVQLLKGATLAKIGPSTLIASGVSGSNPRLAFNPVNETFLLFWLESKNGIPGKELKSRVLNAAGKPAGDRIDLATAVGSGAFSTLSISTNQKSGNLVAILLLSDGTKGKLTGYNIRPNGTLLKNKALSFQTTTEGLLTTGDASFADNGKGLGFWNDRDSIRYRRITATGGFASAAKKISAVADSNSAQTSILFDSRGNQFIGVWGAQNEIRALALNAAGAVTKQTFTVAEGGSDLSNVATSYDAQVGNVIVVYDEKVAGASIKYRVKASVFFMESAATERAVTIGDNFFSGPQGSGDITVQAGDTVKWTNNGNNPHTVTSGTDSSAPGALFDSGNLSRGDNFSFRFTNPGEYRYFCRVHGGGTMSGTVTVQSEGEPPPRY